MSSARRITARPPRGQSASRAPAVGFCLCLSVFFAVLLPGFSFATTNSGISYHGRILRPDGSPLTGASTEFKLQIRTPDATNCLMYEETQSLDMRNSEGVFSITLNDGTGNRTDVSGYGLDSIFANRGSFTFNAANCNLGNAYTPNQGDGRRFQVYFKDETMADFEVMPPQMMSYVPLAIEAKQVGGFSAANLLRVENASGPQPAAPLSPANFTELLALLGGTSQQYVRTSSGTGADLPVVVGAPATPGTGAIWFDSTAKKVEFYDGVSTQTVGTGGGSVSSVATGTGLTGGPITSSGTISIAPGGVGTTQLSDAGVTSAKLDPAINITTTGNVVAANVSSNLDSTNQLRLTDAGSGHKITMTTPNLAADYSLIFPTGAGTSGYVLTTDGTGNLSWTLPSAGSVSSVGLSLPSIFSVTGSPVTNTGTLTATLFAQSPNLVFAGPASGGAAAPGFRVLATGDLPAGGYDSTYFKNGGNSFGSAASLGTNDNFALGLRTNGTTQVTIDTSGNVGIGTTAPASKLDVAGSVRIAMDASTCAAGLSGALRYNGGLVEYCNGTNWIAFAASGVGIASLGGLSANVQNWATPGTAGTKPNWTNNGTDTHILNIPMASGAGVTAGLIAKMDYDNFNAKMGGTLPAAQIWVGNTAGVAAAVAPGGDVAVDSAGVFTVVKLRGKTLDSTAPTADGEVLRWDNAGLKWTPAYLSMADIHSTITPTNTIFPVTPCTSDKTLTWSSLTDTFTCQSISVADSQLTYASKGPNLVFAGPSSGGAAAPTWRALAAADLPAGTATQWVTNGSAIYYGTGNVGIGSASPAVSLDLSQRNDALALPVGTLAQRPVGGNGLLRYNSTSQRFEAYENGQWTSYATSSSVVNSSGVSGAVQFSGGAGSFTSDAANYFWDTANHRLGLGTNAPTAGSIADFNGTGAALSAIVLPRDSSGNRPTAAVNGMARYNTTNARFEVYENGQWASHVNSANGYVNGGNSFGGAATLGTNDANTLTLKTGGSTAVTIDTAQKVGVGTATVTAGALTEFYGVGVGASSILLPRDTTANRPTTGVNGMIRYNTSVAGLESYMNGSWQSIATSVAGGYLPLAGGTMSGAINMGGSAIQGTNTAAGNLTLDSTSDASKGYVLINTSGGNVGVGTTSPGAALDVNGTTRSSNFSLSSGGMYSFANDGTSGLKLLSYNNLSLNVNGSSRLAIVGSGNVGIGTTTPASILDVYGTGTAASAIVVPRDTLGNRPTTSVNGMFRYNTTAQKMEAYENGQWTSYATSAAAASVGASGAVQYANGTGGFISDAANYFWDATNHHLGLGTNSPAIGSIADFNGTGAALSAIVLPRDTSANRPTAAVNGMIRYNTSTAVVETYMNGNWQSLATSVAGGYLPLSGGTMTGAINMGGSTIQGANSASGNLTLDSTSNASKGNVLLNPSGGYVGIGTTSPAYTFDVQGSDVYAPVLRIQNNSSTAARYPNIAAYNYTGGNGGASGLAGYTARGTATSPAPVQLNDELAFWNGWGQYDTTSGHFGQGAAITITADGTFTPTSFPTQMAFFTTPAGSAASVQVMTLSSSGKIGVGTNTPAAALDIYGTGANSALLVPRDSLTNRPTSAINGMFRYNSTAQNFEGYQNGGWQSLATAVTGGYLPLSGGTMTGAINMGGSTINGDTAASGNLTLDSNSTGTKGYVLINPTGGNVGIGTTAPVSALDVTNTSNSTWRGLTLTQNSNDGTSNRLNLRKSRAGAAVTTADALAYLAAYGDNGTGYNSTANASMLVLATQTFTPSAMGTQFIFQTTPANSNTQSVSAAISSTGIQALNSDQTVRVRALNDSSTSGHSPGFEAYNWDGTGFGGFASIFLSNSRGSQASPSALKNNDTIAQIQANGYDGAASIDVAKILIQTDADYTSTEHSTHIAFYTRTANSTLDERMRISSAGNVGIGTASPGSPLDLNQPTASSATIQAQKAGTYYWKVATPTNAINAGWNAASAVEYVGKDNTTGRSINAAGTVNATGADFAEWVDWSGSPPEMGSIIFYKGSYVVVSSPFTAAFIGNDAKDPAHSILVAFAGQLPILIRGKVHEGDLIVANGDGTGRAIARNLVTLEAAVNAVGTAWASSEDESLKRLNVAVGIGLGGHGAREIALLKAENTELRARDEARARENAELKARMDRLEQLFKNSK